MKYIIIVNYTGYVTAALSVAAVVLVFAPAAYAAVAGFVDASEDPQTYVDRYETDEAFKKWFDEHYAADYGTIYAAVGLPIVPAPFVDADPQTYVDRYEAQESFRDWFDEHYSEYDSIYHAVGLSDPDTPAPDAAAPADTDLPAPEPRNAADLAPFVDMSEDPQTYVDRYETDEAFKKWFDEHYAADYGTIYAAVGLPIVPAPFVDADPQTYVDRYDTDEAFKKWFDENYSEYDSIHHAVGLPGDEKSNGDGTGSDNSTTPDEPEPELPPPVIAPGAVVPPGLELLPGQEFGECGEGTELVENYCVIIGTAPPLNATSPSEPAGQKGGGGCLIATAVYGSELAPQVQMLREIRDDRLMTTQSGLSFMGVFNHAYYSFSPAVADAEREHPALRDATRSLLTPLIYTLGIMEHADSEPKVVAYGVVVILANIMIYVGIPVFGSVFAFRCYMAHMTGYMQKKQQTHAETKKGDVNK